MAAARVLVTVEHAQGTGGVVREDGHAWLSLRVPRPVTRLDDLRPAVIGLDDRTLQGGLLAPGAVAAWVTDDGGERHRAAVGDGAWAIVLEQPTEGRPAPVCFRDAAGALVAAELPVAWARTPVHDAQEPCPACGSGPRRRAAWTVAQRRSLLVDGEPLAVAAVAWGEHWSAAGRRGDRLLIVTASGARIEEVELVSLADPLAALDSM